MEEINQDDVILDMKKIAAKLNTNMLSEEEYVQNGGKYPLSIFYDFEDEIGGFANNLALAGLKNKPSNC